MLFILRRFLPQNHRRMKKFVLHFNRCTVEHGFFTLILSVYKRKVPLCPFFSEQTNFSTSDRLGRNFPTVQNGPEKRKNLYLIKLVTKWKRAIRKGHTSFLVFHFWDLELVPIHSALNSASTKKTTIWDKMGPCVTFSGIKENFFDSSTFVYTRPVTRLHLSSDSSTLIMWLVYTCLHSSRIVCDSSTFAYTRLVTRFYFLSRSKKRTLSSITFWNDMWKKWWKVAQFFT